MASKNFCNSKMLTRLYLEYRRDSKLAQQLLEEVYQKNWRECYLDSLLVAPNFYIPILFPTSSRKDARGYREFLEQGNEQ